MIQGLNYCRLWCPPPRSKGVLPGWHFCLVDLSGLIVDSDRNILKVLFFFLQFCPDVCSQIGRNHVTSWLRYSATSSSQTLLSGGTFLSLPGEGWCVVLIEISVHNYKYLMAFFFLLNVVPLIHVPRQDILGLPQQSPEIESNTTAWSNSRKL